MFGFLTNRRRVPRKFLRPRSMQTPARQQHPFWDIVPLEFIATMLMVATLVLAPLRAADAWFNAQVLSAVGKNVPPDSVMVVAVPARLASGCREPLERTLKQGGARGVILVPPIAGLCGLTEPRLAELPVIRLSQDAVQQPPGTRVVGFTPRPVDYRSFAALKLHDAAWVAPRQVRSVPTVSLADFEQKRLPVKALRGRVAVVAIEDTLDATAHTGAPLPVQIGAAVAAAIEDRPRRSPNPLGLGAVAVFVGAVLGVLSRKRGLPRPVRAVASYGLALALVAAEVAGALGYGFLIPIPSSLLAGLVFFGTIHLPRLVAARRADSNASVLLAQARDLGSRENYELSDEEFWNRLTKRVEHSHPADSVLVAELPPFAWRLRVHPNGDLNESIIRERRRDVRRFPYSDDNGQRVIRIHRGFLVMPDVPTVLVPLEAQGEPEGYIFLIGKTAEDAFLSRPELTQQLAESIADLIRHRRLERLRADDWRRPGGVLVNNPKDRAQEIMSGARAAIDRLELFKALVLASPVGLLYADSFGDVRLLTQSIATTLTGFGIQVPPLGDTGTLEPGALALTDVLEVLSREAGVKTPTLEDITESGTTMDISLSASSQASSRGETLLFAVRRFAKNGTPGFVASLVEVDQVSSTLPPNVEFLTERGDPLVVLPLSRALQDMVSDIAPRTDGKLRLQTPRFPGYVVAHREEVLRALEAFLLEAAAASGTSGPTLVMKERGKRVELVILDLQLGAPAAALKRTLLAPSKPPPGLQALGELTRAIENSHGSVTLRNEEGWSTQLTASFVRANPHVVLRCSVSPAPRLRRASST